MGVGEDTSCLRYPQGPPGAPLPKSPPSAAGTLVDTSGCSWNILSLPASRRPGTQKDAGCPEPAIRAPHCAGGRREAVTQARAPGPRSREGARTASGTRAAPAPFLPEHN